jgi:hypothetical protein
MKFIIYSVILIVVVAIACKKTNGLTDKPQLKVVAINSKEVFGNDPLVFTIHLSDKEGDFTKFFGFKTKVPNCPASEFADSTIYSIPQTFIDSRNREGDIVLTLTKQNRHSNFCRGTGNTFKTDTTTFYFWTKDQAGNKSDTVMADPVIIHY